jgi:hypothetical protein
MADKTVRKQIKQANPKGRELVSKRNPEDSGKSNTNHEPFLAYLKSRHGYSNEQAGNEMNRLLNKYHKINRNSGLPHPKTKIVDPPIE